MTKPKYSNVLCVCHYGHSHRSKLESAVCLIIYLREKAGEIKLLQVEETIVICGPPGHSCPKKKTYIADFKVLDLKTNDEFRIESKGFATEMWPVIKKLWMHYGPSKLEIWRGTHQRPYLAETLSRGTALE